MKKITIIIALALVSNLSFGQSMFDTLEDMDGVSSVVVNKDAFEILSKFKVKNDGNEAVEIFSMIQDLEELKFFKTEDSAIANQMEAMVSKTIKKSNLIELMRANDKDSRVKIYVKASKNKEVVSEVLMFSKGNNKIETSVVSLTGLIDINKLSKIADTISKESDNK